MSDLKVKIKLGPGAVMPKYATDGSGAMDIVATSIDIGKKWSDFIEYGTGIFICIPDGYVGLLFPRSSVSNKELLMCNSVGVIDSDYRGEIKVRFKIIGNGVVGHSPYWVGDKIAQLMIIPVPRVTLEQVEELSTTNRGEGGFGSTGI